MGTDTCSKVCRMLEIIGVVVVASSHFSQLAPLYPTRLLIKLMFDASLNTLEHFNTDAKLEDKCGNFSSFQTILNNSLFRPHPTWISITTLASAILFTVTYLEIFHYVSQMTAAHTDLWHTLSILALPIHY